LHNLTATVAIITKDRPEMIERLLESLTRQTQAPDEVLVVDNNSTRSYAPVWKRFAPLLPLRVVVETAPGIPAARNRCIQETRTDLILFTDDDCEVSPQWVEQMVAPFLRDPHIGAVGGPLLSTTPRNVVEEYYRTERGGSGRA
jgi:glycosyltransferase involved in cell wall biosynthesis